MPQSAIVPDTASFFSDREGPTARIEHDERAAQNRNVHPDHQAEQAYIDRAYESLAQMRSAAEHRRDAALDTATFGIERAATLDDGLGQARLHRDAFAVQGEKRVRQLTLREHALVFGRMDLDDDESLYVGRLAVAGPHHESVVMDWRAPAAEPFYRATARHRLGIRRRRHLLCEGPKLVAIEDEVFLGDDEAASGHATSHALLAALGRAGSGRMGDIVATIQREQDEIIRDELPGVFVVQGGPGTGKTVVALHRAAYLLFTHRAKLARQGLLVVGPNQVFLHYIDQVLPALGESGVALTTVTGLVDGVPVRATDPPDVAKVKGDARMAEVIARAVADRQRALTRDLVIPIDGDEITLSVADSERIIANARDAPGPHNARRAVVEQGVLRHLRAQASNDGESSSPRDGRDPLLRHPAVARALEWMWPVLTPSELVHDLLGAKSLIASAARGGLTDDERDLLFRPWSSADDALWTHADLPLVDEAAGVLGPVDAVADPDDEDAAGIESYGHIVVDEAQDLSPMQLRMLARRSLTGSMTVVGDIAQASGTWAPAGWEDVVTHLPPGATVRMAELSINYRTPTELMDLASGLLRAIDPALPAPRSVRSTGTAPLVVRAERERLCDAVAHLTTTMTTQNPSGTLAVIVPDSLHEKVASALRAAGQEFIDAADRLRADERVSLVSMELVKGLEFDDVIVVEPGRVVEDAPHGLRALYVAITRATQRLAIVHSHELPLPLTAR